MFREIFAIGVRKAKCKNCGKTSELISEPLGACLECIREDYDKVEEFVKEAHRKSRIEFDLPVEPPKTEKGRKCNFCVNECQMGEGEVGFCGLRRNESGRLVSIVGNDEALVQWYYDSLPTNCVADWVCPGGTGAGYPKYAYRAGPEYGYKNLAVFYGACSFNCLFCQNWHFRDLLKTQRTRPLQNFIDAVDSQTACICYFGGDPAPQMIHSIKAAEKSLEKAKGRILRICWETNGTMNRKLLERAIELALETGGCIKFDLKAWTENLNIALTGISNKRTLENFAYLAERSKKRPVPPLAVASTLLVPGYVDVKEVSQIAKFIASINPEIPYSLLGFYPHFYMYNLPTTSKNHATQCLQAAQEAGLKFVKIGNIHLLSNAY